MDKEIKKTGEQSDADSAREKRVLPFLPRLIRLRDAPFYLGMDRNKFNAMVRPYLTEIPLGTQAIAFDWLELDAWCVDCCALGSLRNES